MRHFPLTKTDWQSERSKGGSESEGSRRGEERAWRERGIVAGAHGLPSRAPQPRLSGWSSRSLAWRRGGKGEAPALARLAMGHRASGGSSAGAGGVESTRGLVLPCHSPRRQMELLERSTHKSPSSHPAHIKYGSQTSTMLPLGSPPSASPVLSDRPCPTCLSLVTLKKEELAMGGWEEGEEGREEGE